MVIIIILSAAHEVFVCFAIKFHNGENYPLM